MVSNDPSIPLIKNLLLLDSEGKRIAVKYYSPEWKEVTDQAAFEKSVYAKTKATNARGDVPAEIIMFDNVIVLYKFVNNLMFYVTAAQDENELLIYQVLSGFYEALNILLRGAVEKKVALENLDLVLLTIDEFVDGGLILETDAQAVVQRVNMRTNNDNGMPLSEQSLSKAFHNAKDHLARSLLR